ncbi:poly(3-hydroxybutyrate) depolymerase [Candidatus Aenigmatarchaeota archaeon]
MKYIPLLLIISVLVVSGCTGSDERVLCEDDIHYNDESWKNDCNTCGCDESGVIFCTEIDCRQLCEDEIHYPGDTWDAGDDCNTCGCLPDGEIVCSEDDCSNSFEPGDYRFEITHGGIERYYLLHVPESYSGESVPLVMGFHGGLGHAETIERFGWKEKSDEEGFIFAAPSGVSRLASGDLATWNAGDCCGYAIESQSDDVGFVEEVIKDIESKISINGKIFATGFSNGGMLSHRLACEISNKITAIGPVAGPDMTEECNPENPIPIIHTHAIDDPIAPYEGGFGSGFTKDLNFVPVSETISRWVDRNNCNNDPERVFENEGAYCDLYTGCTDDANVKLCTTIGGGHSWPGSEVNHASQAISATDEIWDFFNSID